MSQRKITLVLLISVLFSSLALSDEIRMVASDNVISLKGEWRFQVDPQDIGITEKWFSRSLSELIKLPGSMVENGKGDELTLKTKWTGSIYDSSWFYNPRMAKYRQPGDLKFPFWLTPDKYYVGAAWYQKEVEIPKDWRGKRVVLFLERPHWESTVWVDEKEIGMQNSLSTPHEYDITGALSPGKHRITIRIDNRIKDINPGPDSHSLTDHTQGNWNGIVGKIELIAGSPLYFDDIRVFPDLKDKNAKLQLVIHNNGKNTTGKIKIAAESFNTPEIQKVAPFTSEFSANTGNDTLSLVYPMGQNVRMWDEFNPALYQMTVTITDNSGNSDNKSIAFGMRDFKTVGTHFEINGRTTFLRGTVENCVFPLTGYPPMDEESWARVFRICKENGLNHMRFHSFCPPEAAFEAADKAGFYLQPEGPSWANHGSSLGDGRPIDKYIWDETERIVKAYGNHPSFCMFAYGNEPRGRYVKYLSGWLNHWKAKDNRRLYTGASIAMSWTVNPEDEYIVRSGPRGIKWKGEPESSSDYRATDIANWKVPYVAHEMGQWCAFPDFKEIKKFTGPLKAKNYELFQEDLNDNHMGDQAEDFLMASGKLQALCYKTEIETALRTPGMAGFQLLSLNDYPGQGTALVGLLDFFWDEKGYINAKEFSSFCNSTVPLVRFPKFVYTNQDTLSVEVEVAHFGTTQLNNMGTDWRITNASGTVVASGSFPGRDIPIGNCISLGKITRSLSDIEKASKLKLEVTVGSFSNHWEFWVYPAVLPQTDQNRIYSCSELDSKAVEVLNNGGKVLLLAAGKVENGKDVKEYFTPVFWNTSWFKMRPPHTTGILVQAKSPAFDDFPTEYHSNYQWWDLVNNQQVMNLENFPLDFRPLVQPIDTWFINRRLALLFEANVGKGRIMVCSADLQKNLGNRPAARQLLYSLTNYMNSDKFSPKYNIDLAVIKELFEVKDRKTYNSYTKDSPDELKPNYNKVAKPAQK
ncbi:MAG TPA: sugar-binding domain-containing protein [Bacteroidales bacterium]